MAEQRPADLWREAGATGTATLFDMLDPRGLPASNIIGLGDPDVHFLDNRWTMFLGGFTTSFRVRLFEATLPVGHELDSTAWRLTPDPRNERRALVLHEGSRRGQWDSYGMHTPSYVRGLNPSGSPIERIYYAGRSTSSSEGPDSRYTIGTLERIDGRWIRHPLPVMRGTDDRPSAFEPLVRFLDDGEGGRWQMWYLSAIGEVGRGEQPDYEIRYAESDDGLTNWSSPRVVFERAVGFFDNAVLPVDNHYEMITASGTNLFGTQPYPPQGLWWLRAPTPSGDRSDWTARPVRLLDTDVAPLHWFARGTFGPSFHYGRREEDRDTLYIFFSGTHGGGGWTRAAWQRLVRGKLPPVPAPYFLATGRITIENARQRLAAA